MLYPVSLCVCVGMHRDFPDHFDESKLFQGNSMESKKLKVGYKLSACGMELETVHCLCDMHIIISQSALVLLANTNSCHMQESQTFCNISTYIKTIQT